MVMVFISTLMEVFIRDIGKMINKKDLDLKVGLINQVMKGNIIKERNMVRVNINGKMEVIMKVIGQRI